MKKVRRLLALLMAVSIAVVSAGCSKEITAEDLMVNIEENNASELDLDDAFCEKYSVAAFKMLKNNAQQNEWLQMAWLSHFFVVLMGLIVRLTMHNKRLF